MFLPLWGGLGGGGRQFNKRMKLNLEHTNQSTFHVLFVSEPGNPLQYP